VYFRWIFASFIRLLYLRHYAHRSLDGRFNALRAGWIPSQTIDLPQRDVRIVLPVRGELALAGPRPVFRTRALVAGQPFTVLDLFFFVSVCSAWFCGVAVTFWVLVLCRTDNCR